VSGGFSIFSFIFELRLASIIAAMHAGDDCRTFAPRSNGFNQRNDTHLGGLFRDDILGLN
jgi:hypothetical protein